MIPLTVSSQIKAIYQKNLDSLTTKSSFPLFFVYDHRLEHLQNDFYGNSIPLESSVVTHPFAIASKSKISAFITYLGLVSRYGAQFPHIPYIVKLTGKIPLQTCKVHADNYQLYSVEDVVRFKENNTLHIIGVAAVVYLGTEHEKKMLQNAQRMILDAHQAGLISCLFLYLRGSNIDENNPLLLAGAAGVANVLGADFVKLHIPDQIKTADLELIKRGAGNTQIIYAGGKKIDERTLIDRFSHLLHFSDGFAVGRNIFQRTEQEAISLINKITSLTRSE